jgi:hypothetical protein
MRACVHCSPPFRAVLRLRQRLRVPELPAQARRASACALARHHHRCRVHAVPPPCTVPSTRDRRAGKEGCAGMPAQQESVCELGGLRSGRVHAACARACVHCSPTYLAPAAADNAAAGAQREAAGRRADILAQDRGIRAGSSHTAGAVCACVRAAAAWAVQTARASWAPVTRAGRCWWSIRWCRCHWRRHATLAAGAPQQVPVPWHAIAARRGASAAC